MIESLLELPEWLEVCERYRYDITTRRNGREVALGDHDPFLSDVVEDPDELVNRAGSPVLAKIEAELHRRLLAHLSGAFEPPFVPARNANDLGTH